MRNASTYCTQLKFPLEGVRGLLFYHPDHLGSSSFITDVNGEAYQHYEYMPYGELFVEQKGGTDQYTPYLFNGKELDDKTGLYYYGARYLDPKTSIWLSVDPLAEKYPSMSGYAYCHNNPVMYFDPDGKQIVAVHGTWSNSSTWKDKKGINQIANKLFGNKKANYTFNWSGGNYSKMRTKAAEGLIKHIKEVRKNVDASEPITLVGHSHGGNVAIEAINMMAEMDEFKNIDINLITINTPERSDYQLTEKAKKRVDHVNVYDSKDPVQVCGGNNVTILPENQSATNIGELGNAGRTFDNATNIEVDNPQSLSGDEHNSHNRTSDWSNKVTNTNNNENQ